MRLIQFEHPDTGRCLGIVRDREVLNVTRACPQITSTYAAFRAARAAGMRLADYLLSRIGSASGVPALDYAELLEDGAVLAPITEDGHGRLLVSGTGLTHLGSVEQRDQMHRKAAETEPKSDSRKMFELGLEGGKPPPGRRGAAPEWFYKGDGRILVGPGAYLSIPEFAPDGGEEPEVVGIYIIDDQGTPCRLGFAQGNEWSDHATERINYLYLAPSKLRTCAIGPELVTDLAFDDIHGRCLVRRDGRVIYDSGELLTGEANMSHSLENLEYHHFKFPQHRSPGDIHVHFFGTSKLSFQNRDWRYQDGDEVEVSFDGLGPPLCNPVVRLDPPSTPLVIEPG